MATSASKIVTESAKYFTIRVPDSDGELNFVARSRSVIGISAPSYIPQTDFAKNNLLGILHLPGRKYLLMKPSAHGVAFALVSYFGTTSLNFCAQFDAVLPRVHDSCCVTHAVDVVSTDVLGCCASRKTVDAGVH